MLLEQLLGMQGTQAAGLDGIVSRVRGLAAWQHSLQVSAEAPNPVADQYTCKAFRQ